MDLEALVANARTIQALAPRARLLPMVKANAYGLGVVPVVRALERVDPWGFAVATAHEGCELREAGIRRRVLVMGPQTETLELLVRQDLTPALGSVEQIAAWLALAPGRPFHVEVDTGMARWGLWWESFGAEASAFADAPGFEGVFTHFHSPVEKPETVREQWARLQSVVAALPRRPPLVHAANSAAALTYPDTIGDLARPGIFLFGGRAGAYRPRPVVAWRARVLATRWREAGQTVSYGATYTTAARTCVATLAAGYADGLRRSLSNAGAALVEGRRLPIAGRVTMDFTMVAATGWAPRVGSVATLIGRDGGETIELDDVAEAAGTISYEILTGLGQRVARLYA
ncbi:MAG TPA: alanine racemase [Gemmatimonadales bacterium]|nr:alanine racemase [Gemmatimonadales bacterium]